MLRWHHRAFEQISPSAVLACSWRPHRQDGHDSCRIYLVVSRSHRPVSQRQVVGDSLHSWTIDSCFSSYQDIHRSSCLQGRLHRSPPGPNPLMVSNFILHLAIAIHFVAATVFDYRCCGSTCRAATTPGTALGKSGVSVWLVPSHTIVVWSQHICEYCWRSWFNYSTGSGNCASFYLADDLHLLPPSDVQGLSFFTTPRRNRNCCFPFILSLMQLIKTVGHCHGP